MLGPQTFQYIDPVCREMVPAVVQAGLADAVDAFMEGIAFSGEQTSRVFQANARLACRSSRMRSSCRISAARLAAEFSALSAA
jgi:imidazolonepropionase